MTVIMDADSVWKGIVFSNDFHREIDIIDMCVCGVCVSEKKKLCVTHLGA